MPYSELVKNFERIRDYMHGFYVYGFKSRNEYGQRSERSYDNERRRIDSYLRDYMGYQWTKGGKAVFISIDSREAAHNPLYNALKAKSFTDLDVLLHFVLLDVLADGGQMDMRELLARVDGRIKNGFADGSTLEESTVRKKVKEYVRLGLIEEEKIGSRVYYACGSRTCPEDAADMITFFSEAGVLGVVGSYLLDRLPEQSDRFSFKHHYITGATDSEVLCVLLDAVSRKCRVRFKNAASGKSAQECEVVPLMIYHGAQNGRQHLMAYDPQRDDYMSYRLDYIHKPEILEIETNFDAYRAEFEELRGHMWGVMCSKKRPFEHVEFTVRFSDEERFIPRRLEREKRCGRVSMVDAHTCRFEAELCDTIEIIPWIRTFTMRITELKMDNAVARGRLLGDLEQMYQNYGLKEG